MDNNNEGTPVAAILTSINKFMDKNESTIAKAESEMFKAKNKHSVMQNRVERSKEGLEKAKDEHAEAKDTLKKHINVAKFLVQKSKDNKQ